MLTTSVTPLTVDPNNLVRLNASGGVNYINAAGEPTLTTQVNGNTLDPVVVIPVVAGETYQVGVSGDGILKGKSTQPTIGKYTLIVDTYSSDTVGSAIINAGLVDGDSVTSYTLTVGFHGAPNQPDVSLTVLGVSPGIFLLASRSTDRCQAGRREAAVSPVAHPIGADRANAGCAGGRRRQHWPAGFDRDRFQPIGTEQWWHCTEQWQRCTEQWRRPARQFAGYRIAGRGGARQFSHHTGGDEYHQQHSRIQKLTQRGRRCRSPWPQRAAPPTIC